ncbi:hypothetical protein ACFLTY_02785 [Chloroflexota bacterium]
MRKNLFLYLTLACFIGLIAIFVFDGYMGIYDTAYITAGEREEKIEADTWLRQDSFQSTWINRGEKVFFRYAVANHQFSSYSADIRVSAWRSQEKVLDLLSQPMSIAAFDVGQVEWTVDSTELLPHDLPSEQGYEFSVIIKRGEIERKIIVYVNPRSGQIKPVPAPYR